MRISGKAKQDGSSTLEPSSMFCVMMMWKVLAGAFLWGVVSLGLCLYMWKQNNWAAGEGSQIEGKSRKVILFWSLYALVSFIGGYGATLKSVSFIPWILLFVSYLIISGAAMMDWKEYRIANKFSFFLIMVKLLVILYEFAATNAGLQEMTGSLVGCILCFLSLMLARMLCHGGIGGGDIKLFASLGFVMGTYLVFVVLVFSLIGCTIVSVLCVAMKKLTWKDSLPFGPFIWAGFLMMILFVY